MRLRFNPFASVLCIVSALCVLALVALATLPGASAWAQPGHGRGGPLRYYLALGDSLAFGYQQEKFDKLKESGEVPASAFDTGYVDDLATAIRAHYPRLQTIDDGCPGETSESFIKGPCEYQLAYPLHHPYAGGPQSSQLSDALRVLAEHRNFVNPITLDIGANDVLHVVAACEQSSACIAEQAPATFQRIAADLTLILGDLRQAAPHAKILLLGLYDPYASAIPGADELTVKLNEAMRNVATSAGARFVDPMPEFNPHGESEIEQQTICMLTNVCASLHDIHPTDLGYAVLAGLLYEAFSSYPPFGPPQFGRAARR